MSPTASGRALAFVIAVFSVFTCGLGLARVLASPAQGASDADIIKTLQEAYRWGYPMVAMATNNRETYGSTINAFYNMKTAADEKSQRDRGFNAETLYSAGALDLAKEPVVFSMPKVGDRYVVFPVQDAWGNIGNVIGTRTEGNNGGTYLISGPGWTGTVPKGMKHFRVHTSVAFLPGRSMVRSPEDAKAFAETVQDQFTLTPLSRWGKGAPNPNRDSIKDPFKLDPGRNYNTLLPATPINDYFNQLNTLLVTNPPYDYDKPVLERFAKLGIGPGLKFDINRFSPAVRSAMEEFGRTDVPATAKLNAEKGLDFRMNRLLGNYGTAYWERYYTLFGGLGSNLLEDAAYFFLNKDESGAKLDGNKKYVVRLEAAQIPKTKAFWSLTLYDKDFFLPQGLPMSRHVRNSMNGMRLGPDGSLVIYLQPDSPGPDKADNWLPTPRDGYFVVMRVYGPEGDILTGKWQQPAVRQSQ
jgi:DNA sulfur modification protein DndE